MKAAHLTLGVGVGLGIYGLVLKSQGRKQLSEFVTGAGVVVAVGSAAALILYEGDFAEAPQGPRNRQFPRARRQGL